MNEGERTLRADRGPGDAPVLRLGGIEKTYARGTPTEVQVLRGASLSLGPGEVVALTAPSGAGKSTLLHVAGLLDAPDAGTVEIDGQDATRLSDRARTALRRGSLGFVYQAHHLLPEFTAAENVVLPQLAHGTAPGAARERAAGLLARVGLSERAGHRPSALSGGEAQRVAFCRALANAPRVLLADEPTGNLDPATADRVFDALLSLVRETGMAALVATHNFDLAARMDRVVRLEEGRLAA
jgi:lipoprotein-releasing system ATP-binding protein